MQIECEIENSELRNLLRASTRQAHRKLDSHPMLKPLLNPELTVGHYGSVLQFFFDFYEQLQPSIKVNLSRIPAKYDLADRLNWLRQDISDLEKRGYIKTCSCQCVLPAIDDTSAVVGALYVIEGSSLGGQVIAKKVFESLGFDASFGGRFFNGSGEMTGQHWLDYWDFAVAVSQPEHNPKAADTAVALFNSLANGMDSAWKRQTNK